MKKYDYNLINLKNLKGKEVHDIIDYVRFNGAASFGENDVNGLISLIDNIDNPNLRGYVISYKIERICKEFDVLKIGNKKIVDIEIKLSNRSDKIIQIRKNYEILKSQYSDCDICIYSFVKNNSKIYKYNFLDDELIECDKNSLNNDLSVIKKPELPNINISIKNVYKYPDFFLEGKYFLSNSQETIKNEILRRKEHIFAVDGSGGTGKSLMALDIYKTFQNEKIVFLAPFAAQKMINQKLLDKYNIVMPKYFLDKKEKYDVIIIDEAQRMNFFALNQVLERCNYLILFYCEEQDLDSIEQIEKFLEVHNDETIKRTIKRGIRSDSSIDRYARKICGLKKSKLEDKNFDPNKIKIYMLDEFLSNREVFNSYKLIKPTKSKDYIAPCDFYCKTKKCFSLDEFLENNIVHFEIGQEYEYVVIYLCGAYCVRNNRIDTDLPVCYGNIQKQLYTIITRTINKIIFVCENIEIYNFLTKCKEDLDC